MRILIAGASGAIGRPLVHRLSANQHEVFALTRSPDSVPLREIGAEPVIADALDAAAVKAAIGPIRPDVVINELTSLPRHYTPAEMSAAAERDRKVRVEGNISLLAALRDAGVRRYLLQSSGFWYAPGAGLADESVPFISSASPGVEAGARTYLELEARASATPGIEFVALRYGFFYGPGTWYTREGDIGDQVRQQQIPIIGEGQGVYSFVHIDDAAAATAASASEPTGRPLQRDREGSSPTSARGVARLPHRDLAIGGANRIVVRCGGSRPCARGRRRSSGATKKYPSALRPTSRSRPDARRPAHSLRRRLQEKQQGLQRDLDRVQTPHRRGLRPNPGLLRPDLGLRPRQPGRHSLDDHDERPRLLSLRSHGRRLRRRRERQGLFLEPDAARRMAAAAMSQTFNQVGAAIAWRVA